MTANSSSLIARGAGRAYGDAALNDHNRVVDLTRLNRMLSFDAASGLLRCEAGVTIAELIDVFLPRGFFPPVTPGTRFVTLGGSLPLTFTARITIAIPHWRRTSPASI